MSEDHSKLQDVADAASRGAADAAKLLRERLTHAPNLPQIAEMRARVEAATLALQQAERDIAAAAASGGRALGEAARQKAQLDARQKAHRGDEAADRAIVDPVNALPVHLARSFTEDRHVAFTLDRTPSWESWTPSEHPQGLTSRKGPGIHLRWGTRDPNASVPAMISTLPLIGGGRPWVIVSDEAGDRRARELMQALALRILCMLPHQSRFTFLDPLYYGQTFPLQRYISSARDIKGDLAQDLQNIQSDVRRIIRDVVAFHGSFDALPAEQQTAERYEFIFAADFPKANGYDRRVTEMLFDIGRAGPKAGRYLILHVNDGAELPHGIGFDQLGDAHRIDIKGKAWSPADRPPSADLQQRLLERIRGAVPTRRLVGVRDILPADDRWWRSSAARRIQASLDGQKDGVQVTFGARDDGTELVHGVLAASAGAGKSNLLHALVLGLAATYPPEELRLYLMDLKQGVEFQAYGALPHAAVVAYNTAPALARAVLSELRREMTHRYEELFRPAGVQKLEDYRTKGEPNGPAPRVLLVIDEYHALFQGGDAQDVSGDLLALSTQGRAAGIHMLLGSQTFSAIGMQGATQIFNNINIRMALRIPASAVMGLQEFDREGKEMIRELESTGQVVVNTDLGRDGANKRGQVVLVKPEERTAVLERLSALARDWPAADRAKWPRTQVFDGSRAPALSAHVLAEAARAAGAPLTVSATAQWAQRSKASGGIGRTDWRPSDAPLPLLLGREYAVHGDAAVVLTRLPNQNLLMISSSATARLGMLRGLVASLDALDRDVVRRIRVLDLSGDPAMAATFAACSRITVQTDPAAAVDTINDTPEVVDLLILVEPDRVPALMRSTDPLARVPGPDALERRLREGPLAGRYTALITNSMSGFNRVLGRRGANLFAWRAVTQMSQEDSQDLLGNRLASQLRNEGAAGPESALLADIDGNRFIRFMPYGN
jgi:S-DNA-T family DNA segregation ATPase FtsK/SpoIIIE